MHLTEIYKISGWFFRVTHLVQKFLAKNALKALFTKNLECNFTPSRTWSDHKNSSDNRKSVLIESTHFKILNIALFNL